MKVLTSKALLLVLKVLPRSLALLLRELLTRLVLEQRVVLVVAHDPLLVSNDELRQQTILGQFGMVRLISRQN